jgi:hypothetical protein
MLDDWRRSDSRLSLRELRQQVIVRKRRALCCELLVGAIRLTGRDAAFFNAPSIVSPFAKTSVTFLAATWALNSVYGTACGPLSRSWRVSMPKSTP